MGKKLKQTTEAAHGLGLREHWQLGFAFTLRIYKAIINWAQYI